MCRFLNGTWKLSKLKKLKGRLRYRRAMANRRSKRVENWLNELARLRRETGGEIKVYNFSESVFQPEKNLEALGIFLASNKPLMPNQHVLIASMPATLQGQFVI